MRRAALGLALAASLVPAAGAHAARAPRDQLVRSASVKSLGTSFKRYQQRVGGVPVLGGEVVVTNAPGRRADLTLDRTQRGLRAPGRSTVSRTAAIAAARGATHAAQLRAAPRAGRAILPTAGAGRLVWRVLLASGRPLASYEVLVDARSAAIVRVRNSIKRDTGKAAVFLPNPVVAQGFKGGLADDFDADTPLLTALRTPVTLERLKSGTSCLKGRWVHVTLQTGEVCKPGADFSSVTRSNSDFEALMAYVHIDRARAYLESLGIQHLPERPLAVFADGTSEDESAYDTNDKSITFGTGGVDDAEDADVIVHEYGHAVQDEQVPDFGESLQGGAMGEGFGDYFQAALDAQRAPSATFNPCMGEWDSSEIVEAAPVQCLRRTDTNRTVAQVGPGTSCNTEPHCAGEVWSSALWTIRGLVGGPTADRLVVQSHYALTKTADFVDGATALILTDRALYGGVHEQLLRQVLGARGLFEPKWLTLRLSAQLPSIRTLRRTKRFAVAIDISEAGRVRLTALLVGGAKHGSVVKARTATFRSDGERRVGLTLTRAGRRLLRKRRSVVLRIRAQATFSRGRALPVVQVRRRTH